MPEDGKRVQDKEWQFQTDFSELHTEFPELVDADGAVSYTHLDVYKRQRSDCVRQQ